jgi:hypothetical protein
MLNDITVSGSPSAADCLARRARLVLRTNAIAARRKTAWDMTGSYTWLCEAHGIGRLRIIMIHLYVCRN